ncbi:MAG TPA: hypothetical protein VEH84_00500 [Alphaproteobacteria bacterium]|nr:hypothetical protein [Alphaproteobacteria bacterium]
MERTIFAATLCVVGFAGAEAHACNCPPPSEETIADIAIIGIGKVDPGNSIFDPVDPITASGRIRADGLRFTKLTFENIIKGNPPQSVVAEYRSGSCVATLQGDRNIIVGLKISGGKIVMMDRCEQEALSLKYRHD